MVWVLYARGTPTAPPLLLAAHGSVDRSALSRVDVSARRIAIQLL